MLRSREYYSFINYSTVKPVFSDHIKQDTFLAPAGDFCATLSSNKQPPV